ncbi:MAG: hypothetical protein WDM89_15345 [Rhizomicrobium sp.]
MRRVDRERREHREYLFAKLTGKPVAICVGQFRWADDRDPRIAQFSIQRYPDGLLIGDQLSGRGVNLRKLFGGGQAVVARRGHTSFDHAFQAGDADHIKFVEVGCRDRQEPEALQNRVAWVLRLFEDAPG